MLDGRDSVRGQALDRWAGSKPGCVYDAKCPEGYYRDSGGFQFPARVFHLSDPPHAER
jgi:hypothetical protein